MSILVTGGAGYIGSHATQRLLRDGHTVVVLDNLFRGHRGAIDRLAGQHGVGDRLRFIFGDVGDRDLVANLVVEHRVEAVMHFAALAYVGESVDHPLLYYRNNAGGTLGLLEGLALASDRGRHVDQFVFSSTCATYGQPAPEFVPIPESCPQSPINPYGWSKLHGERMLLDFADSMTRRSRPFALAALRYFNVAGCDRSGVLGEDHTPETHLIPAAIQSVMGTREHFGARGGLSIFGTDYPTPDGTCVRDYVHVEDLIDAHVCVLKALRPGDRRFYNLGIGRGYSVREVIDSVRRVSGKSLDVSEGPRRAGDPPTLFARPDRIRAELGWKASITSIDEIVGSAWNWYQRNPRGYR
jgi:UDP-glucose-4-epimerase GalE